MAGRTLSKWERVYMDGYDLSGYGRSIGPLGIEYAVSDLTAPMSDTVKGYLLGQPAITVGTFNGVMQSTTDSGIEISAIQTAGVYRDIMVVFGDRAEPAAAAAGIGVPVFCAKSAHSGFKLADDGGAITITAEFADDDASDITGHGIAWGKLIHAKGAETAVNDQKGINTGYSSTLGGVMAYQVFAGDWAGTLKIQSSVTDVDGDYVDIVGATVTLANSDPCAGMITIPVTETVKQYVRWQLTTTGGTTITFALAWLPQYLSGASYI